MLQVSNENESVLSINDSVGRMVKLFGEVAEINRQGAKPVFKSISSDEFMQMIRNQKLEASDKISIEGNIINTISSDALRLNIILRNLVQNGLRYGEKVTIKIADDGQRCKIFVLDDGPGVEWGERRRVFQPFFRSQDAARRVPDGIGLGLSIAKKLAHEIQANLELQNPGKPGAIFFLTLKRKT